MVLLRLVFFVRCEDQATRGVETQEQAQGAQLNVQKKDISHLCHVKANL